MRKRIAMIFVYEGGDGCWPTVSDCNPLTTLCDPRDKRAGVSEALSFAERFDRFFPTSRTWFVWL